jgi:general secretion pathway protein D
MENLLTTRSSGEYKTMRSLRATFLFLLFASWPALAQEWTVNLKETDIQELIQFVAEATDTTIVVDPKVKGTVKVVSSKPVSSAELYQLFLSILDVHGYTAVRSGNVVRVIQSKDARSSPVRVETIRVEPSDEYVTQVIRLENISAAKLIPVLRPLVPQQAHMAAYAPSNAIIISDIAANIDRIRVIIESMDQGAMQQTEVVKLQYAVAEDVVRMLLELAKTEAKQAGGAEPEILLVADKRTNSVVISGDELERARMNRLINFLDTPLEQSGNVKVIYLEYADATEIAEVLTRVMQNISKLDPEDQTRRRPDSSATIEADEGTNALIITADTDEMQSIEAVIQRLDIRRAQVLVEAIIAELEIIDGQDLGIQWLFRNDDGAFGSNIVDGNNRAQGIAEGIFQGGNTSDDNGDIGEDVNRGDFLGALAATPGVSLGWGQLDENLDIAIILNALKSQTNANILSTPSLLTLDNQEAYITVGNEVPFVTGSFSNTGGGTSTPTNPFQTIERENVGITLTVTPHVNEGDLVQLDISQEVSSLTGGGVAASLLASDIITNERKIETKVLAGDGRTVVLGGLIEEELQDATQKVPFLGDIPWLGRLFRSDAVNLTQSNLLIFIKPTIIRDDRALEGATAQKYRYIRAQQQMRIDAGIEFMDEENIPILPEWEEQLKQLKEIKESDVDADAAGAGADQEG